VKPQAEELKKKAMNLWAKTVQQIEALSTVMKAAGLDKLKFDRARLLEERDRLIARLGEETFRLIESGRIRVPGTVSSIYLRLRDLMDRLMLPQEGPVPGSCVSKPTKKPATRKRKAARASSK
jgi:hypothetical protein